MSKATATSLQPAEHPVLDVLHFLVRSLGLYLSLGLACYLGCSLLVHPRHMRQSLLWEQYLNGPLTAVVLPWSDTEPHAAQRLAYRWTAVIAPKTDRLVNQTEENYAEIDPAVYDQHPAHVADSMHARISKYVQETIWPVQRYYLPLVFQRSLMLAACCVSLPILFIAIYFRGQARRRQRLKTGDLLMPHRYHFYRRSAVGLGTLLCAYPFVPLAMPVLVVLPLLLSLLLFVYYKMCAEMVDV